MSYNCYLFVFYILGASLFSTAQINNEFYDSLDAFLSKTVMNGKVDYSSIKKNPDELLSIISRIEQANLAELDDNEKKAFYVNAYNLLVIKSVVDRFPIKSPLDVNGFFDAQKHLVAGEEFTLNQIENKKLRETYNDARVHFVLVCGALGCPPIINLAYRPEMLDKQLEDQTIAALNNDEFIRPGRKVALSQIFEWYKDDFTQGNQSLIDFVNKYRTSPFPRKTKTKFYTYNWALNIQ